MILVCGEALVDLVRAPGGHGSTARPGGSPANVAVGLGRLGTPVALLARLGNDEYADLLRAHLTASGVDLSWAVAVSAPATVAVAEVGADGAATYTFAVDGRTDGGWSVADLPDRLPPEVVAVQVSGSLALAVPALGAVVEELMIRARRDGRTVVLDPNVRPALLPDHGAAVALLERWIGLADVVKVSEDDLGWLYPGAAAEAVAAQWQAEGPRLVTVTRGAAGALARLAGGRGPYTSAVELSLPAEPVTLVDTVGAGDAFTAGLLDRLHAAGRLGAGLADLAPAELAEAVGEALHVAALTCARPGADPPRRGAL